MSLITFPRNPSPRQIRQFSLLSATFCLILAARLYWRSGSALGVWCLATFAAGLGLAGYSWPRGLRFLYAGIMAAVFPLGWVMSQAILAVIYFGMITPLALVFRLAGRDALQRRFDPAAVTYWQPRSGTRNPRDYLRQF
jgi:hypothetical protein